MDEDPAPDQFRWLTDDELDTWRALNVLMARLQTVLGQRLQADSGLSFLEYYVLASLSEQPGHTMRMSRLALLANSELSRLSHLVARLEKRGWVRRETDPTDRRFTNAILTDAGYRHLVAAAPGHVDQVRRLVFDSIDADTQRAVGRAARQILAQIDDEGC